MDDTNKLIDRVLRLERKNQMLEYQLKRDSSSSWVSIFMRSSRAQLTLVTCYILLFLIMFFLAPYKQYMDYVVELKGIEVKVAASELGPKNVDVISGNSVPKDSASATSDNIENNTGLASFTSKAWKFLREWIFPTLIVVALVCAGLYFAYIVGRFILQKINTRATNLRVRASSFLSVVSSLLGSSIAAVRYWRDMGENPAVEYVFYSSGSCLVFILILLTSRNLFGALFAYAILVGVLFSTSYIGRNGQNVVVEEYAALLGQSSIPSGSILLLGVIMPIIFVFATSIVYFQHNRSSAQI